MNEKVYRKLQSVAKAGTMITYSELNTCCKLNLDFNNIKDRNIISKILGEISQHEVKEGRPMLSAVVILKGTVPPFPAHGFFNYASELGVRNPGEADLNLWYRQLKKSWDFWK